MFRGLDKFILLGALVAGGQTSAAVIDGEELVDPTRPLNFSPETVVVPEEIVGEIRAEIPPGYEISFIRAGGSSPVAVINGQSVSIGEFVGGATVVEIDRNGVTLLTTDGQETRVGLSSFNIRPEPDTC